MLQFALERHPELTDMPFVEALVRTVYATPASIVEKAGIAAKGK